jgi:hypothetical protein
MSLLQQESDLASTTPDSLHNAHKLMRVLDVSTVHVRKKRKTNAASANDEEDNDDDNDHD